MCRPKMFLRKGRNVFHKRRTTPPSVSEASRREQDLAPEYVLLREGGCRVTNLLASREASLSTFIFQSDARWAFASKCEIAPGADCDARVYFGGSVCGRNAGPDGAKFIRGTLGRH